MIRTRIAALVLALGAALAVLGAGPAQAATGYRYWSFWEGAGGKWAYATQGPATARPADGDVIGFRFSVSEDSGDSAKPRRPAGFDAVCGKTPAKDGAKRIAVVIDAGTPADAPDGERPPAPRTACATAAPDGTAADALASVAKPLRYNSGALLCAVSGYPKTGCGEQVSGSGDDTRPSRDAPSATPSSADDSSGGGPSAGLLAGLGAVLALGAAGVWQARRRRG
ncbi:SCO2322 family protein [Streptomyces hypolithicus]